MLILLRTVRTVHPHACLCRGPLPWAENKKLITVTWPVTVPPICLELALGTRVCAVRVDSAQDLMRVVGAALLSDESVGCCICSGPDASGGCWHARTLMKVVGAASAQNLMSVVGLWADASGGYACAGWRPKKKKRATNLPAHSSPAGLTCPVCTEAVSGAASK